MHYKKEAISYPGIGEVHLLIDLEGVQTRPEIFQRMVPALLWLALHRCWRLHHVLAIPSHGGLRSHPARPLHGGDWDAKL
jgi:hypothetical protein